MSSLKTRFIVVLACFIFVSEAVLLITSISSIKRVGELSSWNAGEPVLERALKLIDADKFEKLASSLDINDPFYEETRLKLLDLKEATNCSFVYTMAQKPDGTFVYVIDGSCDPSDEENFSPLGAEEDLTTWGDAPLNAFSVGGVHCSHFENQEVWGWQVSLYRDIKNSEGKIVGIVACDFAAGPIVKTIINSVIFVFAIAVVFLVVGILVVWLLTKMIFTSMKDISTSMMDIASGEADLTKRIPEKGGKELKLLAKSCNSVISRLAQIITNLKQHTRVLSETGNNLCDDMTNHIQQIKSTASGINEIDISVNIQTKKVESLESSVNGVEAQIQTLDSRLGQQLEAVRISSEAIEKITDDIQDTNEKINTICTEYELLVRESEEGRTQLHNVADLVNQISEQSEQLNEANVAISNIASQTNLLAMNAAIEASHAGEAGKGFNVVAEEIRSLASTSQEQSQSIEGLLNEINTLISKIVESSSVSTQSFDTLGKKIFDIEDRMKQIQGVINNERQSIDNITTTMGTLNSATEEISLASSNMKNESQKLFREIDDLQHISESTRKKSAEVSSSISQIKTVAEIASESSSKNKDASDSVVNMINGFKV